MDTSQPKILEVSGEHDNFQGTLAEIGNWSFDGSSSTRQAEGGSSDTCSYLSSTPTRINGYLVMTEVNSDGTPHSSNGRATIDDDAISGLVLNKSIYHGHKTLYL
jgi:hypothetical protein